MRGERFSSGPSVWSMLLETCSDCAPPFHCVTRPLACGHQAAWFAQEPVGPRRAPIEPCCLLVCSSPRGVPARVRAQYPLSARPPPAARFSEACGSPSLERSGQDRAVKPGSERQEGRKPQTQDAPAPPPRPGRPRVRAPGIRLPASRPRPRARTFAVPPSPAQPPEAAMNLIR